MDFYGDINELVDQTTELVNPKELGEKVAEEDYSVSSLDELAALTIYFSGTGARRIDALSSYVKIENNLSSSIEPLKLPKSEYEREFEKRRDLAAAFDELYEALTDYETIFEPSTDSELRKELWEKRVEDSIRDVSDSKKQLKDIKIELDYEILPHIGGFETQLALWNSEGLLSDLTETPEYKSFFDIAQHDLASEDSPFTYRQSEEEFEIISSDLERKLGDEEV